MRLLGSTKTWRRWLGAAVLTFLLWAPAGALAQDETPAPVSTTGRVEGTVTNLTAGAAPPVGADVVLYLLDDFEQTQTFTATVGSEGQYSFDAIPLIEGTTYIATVEYENVAYGSSFVTYEGEGDLVQLDIEAYEAGSDPAAIQVSRLHVIVEFVDGSMSVSELYIFDNTSDQVYAGPTGVPDQGTLEIPVPANATNAAVERSMGESMVSTATSVVRTDEGFMDTLPVRPGSATQQLMLTYEIPYEDEATLSHSTPYPVNSASLFLPGSGLKVESELFSSASSSAMQGMPFDQWDASNIPAGATLSFSVSGTPEETSIMTSSMPETASSATGEFSLSVQAGDNTTSWILGVGGLALAVVVLAFLWTRRTVEPQESPRDELLHQLAALDDALAQGEIPRARYELERERLKAQLRRWYE